MFEEIKGAKRKRKEKRKKERTKERKRKKESKLYSLESNRYILYSILRFTLDDKLLKKSYLK